jgi:hypothetical protein
MSNIIDIKQARRRPGQRWRITHRPWWRLWFWPPETPPEDLRRLAPEELRRGVAWGPAVDRGRHSGADLRLIYPPAK